jgi:hypothetical protein
MILAQVCMHATMTGMRMATPLLALQQGYSAAAVGMLLALFALTQVFLALPAGASRTARLRKPFFLSCWRPGLRWRWRFRSIRCCAWRRC